MGTLTHEPTASHCPLSSSLSGTLSGPEAAHLMGPPRHRVGAGETSSSSMRTGKRDRTSVVAHRIKAGMIHVDA